jgi:hypothetical protein
MLVAHDSFDIISHSAEKCKHYFRFFAKFFPVNI